MVNQVISTVKIVNPMSTVKIVNQVLVAKIVNQAKIPIQIHHKQVLHQIKMAKQVVNQIPKQIKMVKQTPIQIHNNQVHKIKTKIWVQTLKIDAAFQNHQF